MPQPASDQVLTLQELSLYIKIAESSVYKLVREGKIPGQKVGKSWRFYKPAIDRWLAGDTITIKSKKKNENKEIL
jgi:excisionase family DNA binding protein